MAVDAVWKIVYRWEGSAPGMPGYTTLYFDAGPAGTPTSPQAAVDAGRAFFSTAFGVGVGTYLPQNLKISSPSVVDAVQTNDGGLVTSVAVTKPADVVGQSTQQYAGGSGACITWTTGSFLVGNRVRGRTFLVPLSSAGMQSDGTLATAFITDAGAAATALIAAIPDLVVYHRPSSAGATDGVAFPVLGYKLTDKAAQLRSRRD